MYAGAWRRSAPVYRSARSRSRAGAAGAPPPGGSSCRDASQASAGVALSKSSRRRSRPEASSRRRGGPPHEQCFARRVSPRPRAPAAGVRSGSGVRRTRSSASVKSAWSSFAMKTLVSGDELVPKVGELALLVVGVALQSRAFPLFGGAHDPGRAPRPVAVAVFPRSSAVSGSRFEVFGESASHGVERRAVACARSGVARDEGT